MNPTDSSEPASPAPVFLELQDVSKHYGGVQALSGVNITLRAGEVHCLCGQNGSGKSTLIKIISGVEQPDAGARLLVDCRPHARLTPVESTRLGIQVIYQDLSLFPNLTVAENIAIAQHLGRLKRIDRAAQQRIARAAIDSIGVQLDPDALAGTLGIAQRQLVAICRAMAAQARLVIMDEPTASLTRHEVDALLALTLQLRDRGVAVIFVSHRLDEVMEVAERVTVLRDGASQGCFPVAEMTDDRLTFLMTGREFRYVPRGLDHSTSPVVLSVDRLARAGEFEDVSLEVRAGEIVGITGLLGAGRTELALALFGMTAPDRGEIRLAGQPLRLKSNRDAIDRGIAYLAEDRLGLGLLVDQSIGTNLILSTMTPLKNAFGLISGTKRAAQIRRSIAELSIKTRDPDNAVSTLSGGNQQRVALGKWLATKPRVLILDSPTVGVDIAAKAGIYAAVRQLAASGLAVILISDEIHEVLHHSDRILIMKQGRVADEFVAARTTAHELQEAVDA